MSNSRLNFLTTKGCHLCDQALDVIAEFNQLMAEHDFMLELDIIEIADNEDLVLHYGTQIPVLMHEPSGKELKWPFESAQIYHFLRKL